VGWVKLRRDRTRFLQPGGETRGILCLLESNKNLVEVRRSKRAGLWLGTVLRKAELLDGRSFWKKSEGEKPISSSGKGESGITAPRRKLSGKKYQGGP